MTLSLLQLNINSDNFWDKLIPYLKSHDFDVLQFQEMTGKGTINGNINAKIDTFIELQNILKEKYNGELSVSQRYTSSPDSYMGNATFYKKSLHVSEKKIYVVHDNKEPFPSDSNQFGIIGRTILHLTFEIDGKKISFLNGHLAWAPTSSERPYQTEQGEKIINYLQTVPHPFVFSGDFNLNPQQPFIKKLEKIARNLTNEYKIKNTLNPRTHLAKELFPNGVAVDYIFITDDITLKSFSVVEDNISDHFGLQMTIEV
jgi:endonuclease/exonuclease/phosphatase family metal-dependent hydrolase